MDFIYGKQDMRSLAMAQEKSVLLTNGLGGYSSVTAAFSVNRCDQGIFVAAVTIPNERITMVHRMREKLEVNGKQIVLSSQGFSGRTGPEEGYRCLTGFSYGELPVWSYQAEGVSVRRTLSASREKNAAVVLYELRNNSRHSCTLELEPFLKFAPKEHALTEKKKYEYRDGVVTDGTYTMYIQTGGSVKSTPRRWQCLAYPEDAKDGRPAKGYCGSCFKITDTVMPGETKTLEVIFSTEEIHHSARQLMDEWLDYRRGAAKQCGLTHPIANRLALAADDFIVRRASTQGKTILAGYPLFSDWGRDTMIALPGCCLTTGRYEDARSILRTFFAYEKDGLVPNLFPEGQCEPMYNTVDAALLLIDCVWQYVSRTGDLEFAREAWPVMKRIISGYRKGTHHSIGMDTDGLIFAGGGLDQVTWMDVCVNGILPTPRHGKPVEVNAYWYSALCVMDRLAEALGEDRADYAVLAEQVKESFVEKFYMPEKGYLRDVISGTAADEQLRCNQIWALSMPFTMLDAQQERSVFHAVGKHLHTPCGLRTLSPEDPEYHPTYGGPQVERDMAYHQGTTWVFPMGAYYLAWLKVNGNSQEAAAQVEEQLQALIPMLREGCLGQLPEIYDGECPGEGKGCFAQAWSVGEMLRVLEAIEKIKK